MRGKKLITGEQRLIYLNNLYLYLYLIDIMFELILYYVSVLIINFISTYLWYVCLFYFIYFLGGFCHGVGG